MKPARIVKVESRRDLKRFVHFPNELYKHNVYYVPQIESMDLDTMTPGKNRAFEVCEGSYWLAYDENGKIVGRIAGIINHEYNRKVGKKICRFNWIDFIDDQDVCKALLEVAEAYAREKGMEEIEGPVGFLEFDVTGVLTEGFDQLPTAYGKYNSPYYEPYILNCGYEKATGYVEYLIKVPEVLDERYGRFAKIVADRYELHQAHIPTRRSLRPYFKGVFECMNRCYSKLEGYSELTDGQCDDLIKQFVPNLNPDLVSIILDKNERVVAFAVTMPSLARAMQKAKGHMFPFGWYHILRAIAKNDTIDALLIAIDDDYKDKGLNSMIFDKLYVGIQKCGVKYVESTRELESNVNVQNMWGRFERKIHKRAMTYVKKLA